MLTPYMVTCPHIGCHWSGSLLPNSNHDAGRPDAPTAPIVTFRCPRCHGQWHACLIDGEVKPLPVEPPTSSDGGIAEFVDDLLMVCRKYGLQLDWQVDHCRVRSFLGDWEERVDILLRKSVFRAILARLASLCNERTPDSVSPYGGQGELSAGSDPTGLFRVAIVNTPVTQKLELTTVTQPVVEIAPQQETTEAFRKFAEKYHPDAKAPRPSRGRMAEVSEK